MIVTVQIADLGAARSLRSIVRPSKLDGVDGLRSSEVALFAPLAPSRPPPLGRAGRIAFWDDDAAADRFESGHPQSQEFAGGLYARLRPLRAHGAWPGLDADVPDGRAVPHAGPVVVLTLARLRGSQFFRFARASRPAEKGVLASAGLIWSTAAARPPFLATMSVWEDTQAAVAYAYGKQRPAHNDAIEEGQRKDFHSQQAFIRFAPTRLEGVLGRSNPFDAAVVPVPVS